MLCVRLRLHVSSCLMSRVISATIVCETSVLLFIERMCVNSSEMEERASWTL